MHAYNNNNNNYLDYLEIWIVEGPLDLRTALIAGISKGTAEVQ